MKHSIVLLALLAAPGLALADGFSYDYLQLSYGQVDFDNVSIDGDGFGVDGSFGITESLNIIGGYQTTDFDSLADANQLQVGLGVHTPISETLDVVAAVSYINVDVDTFLGPAGDDDGFGLTAGVRAAITSKMEANAGISYVDFDNSGDETGFGGSVLYNFTDVFSAGLGASWSDDTSTFSIGGRMYFR